MKDLGQDSSDAEAPIQAQSSHLAISIGNVPTLPVSVPLGDMSSIMPMLSPSYCIEVSSHGGNHQGKYAKVVKLSSEPKLLSFDHDVLLNCVVNM